MRTSKSIVVGAVMAPAVATSVNGNSRFDYVAQRVGWSVLGGTSKACVTCGVTNTPAIDHPRNFGIFRRIWQPGELFRGNDGLVAWTMEIGTVLREGTHGHCQVNRLRNKLVLMMPACRALSRLLDRCLLSPGPKRFGPGTPIADSPEAMTPWPEVAVDDAMC